MDGKLRLDRLWRWSRVRPDADAVPDAADVGTAFGMELSIEAEQRKASEAATATEPTKSKPGAARPGR
jgi:hypothetical protein